MSNADASTSETLALPWRAPDDLAETPLLHLVVAWFTGEPERIGHVGRIDRKCFFGRASPGVYPEPLVTFQEVRPGESIAAPLVDNVAISRRQLEFEPVDAGSVRVRCVGRRPLSHNGVPRTECVVRAGDTLMLENAAVFLVEARPPALPPVAFYPAPGFRFGKRDAHGIVGETPTIWRLREHLASIAATNHHVLLLGPSGAGKELAARAVHQLSKEANGPFRARNSATFPSGLVDAELFGSMKNYPNAGSPERDGLIGSANGGSLLLDEIGDLPEDQQVRLLRVLDNGGTYQRLGESIERRSDFRLIGATNRDLSFIKHDLRGRFGARREIPGMEERRGDIPFLITEVMRYLLGSVPVVAERHMDGDQAKIDPVLVDMLLRHRYPLNYRDLHRIIALSAAESRGEYLMATPLVMAELRKAAPESQRRHEDADADAEEPTSGPEIPADQLVAALRECGGNQSRAAERLGVSRHVVRRLMLKYRLS